MAILIGFNWKEKNPFQKESFCLAFTVLIIILTLVGGVFFVKSVDLVAISTISTSTAKSAELPFKVETGLFSAPDTSPALVIRGENDTVLLRKYDFASMNWNDFIEVPGIKTIDGPAAARIGNVIYIVVRGASDNLYFGYLSSYLNGTSFFSKWTLIPGATVSAPTLATDGKILSLVIRGKGDNTIKCSFYNFTFGNWSDWSFVPYGFTDDSPGAAIFDGKLHVVVRGYKDTSIFHNFVDLSTGTSNGWQTVNGSILSSPTLAVDAVRSQLVLVIRGTNNTIFWSVWRGSNWTNWASLGNGLTSDGPAAIVDDQLNVIVLDMDGLDLSGTAVNVEGEQDANWKVLSSLWINPKIGEKIGEETIGGFTYDKYKKYPCFLSKPTLTG